MIEQIVFLILAAVAIGGALSVVLQRSPLYSALSLIVTFAAFSGHYIMLKAQFIAAIQIIVYAGAIIVLFMFVIMLLNVRSEESRIDRNQLVRWIAAPFAVAFLAVLLYAVRGVDTVGGFDTQRSVAVGTVEAIGNGLFTEYLLPFEATSVLIIMAIVGSMVLARRALPPVEIDVSEDLDDAVETEEEMKAEV
jgi:NADH-quinone oxidoreductase subunit J